MGLFIKKPGIFTTVQDLGRPGWRKDGIPEGGAMDRYALRMANLLVGNDEGAAGLELTLVGPELAAERDLLIAVCGAYMSPLIDGEELPMWRGMSAAGARYHVRRSAERLPRVYRGRWRHSRLAGAGQPQHGHTHPPRRCGWTRAAGRRCAALRRRIGPGRRACA